VAADARLSEGVMMTAYVKETDEQMRQKSNRMYQRIAASRAPEVAIRHGLVEKKSSSLKEKIQAAVAAEDWNTVAKLTAKLNRKTSMAPMG
jgi:hypothetical protein